MRPTKLIFIEGIMGTGKTTTAKFLTHYLQQRQIAACFVPEGGPNHPLRVALMLPHPFEVWRDVTIDQYIELSVQKWQHFVENLLASGHIAVLDGLLFHGNLTDVLMMDATPDVLQHYIDQVIWTLSPLQPAVIYYWQRCVSHTIRTVCETRGLNWEAYQINWKVASPYCVRRKLEGYDGFVKLYQTYHTICDNIFTQLAIPKLAIETRGDWSRCYHDILAFLQISDIPALNEQ